MDKVARNGLLTFGLAPKVDTKEPESTAQQGILSLTAAHNRSVVGSSPASATIKSPEIVRFQDFFFVFAIKKFKRNFRKPHHNHQPVVMILFVLLAADLWK